MVFMSFPLISVIVPVYKVEPWLERCVESVRNQSYGNLEIILVDDGSPDRCGEICDRIASEDIRVKVIHRENGGLSAARNSGIDASKGEYIGFVDSDDFIHPEMYSRLFSAISEYGVSLAFCQPVICYGSEASFRTNDAVVECYSSNAIIRKSLSETMWFSAWTKLYHKSLFDGLRFPEGRINEDYPVTMRLFDRCNKVAVDSSGLYAYCKHKGSITSSPATIRSFDQIDSAEDVYLFIKETHPDCSDLAARILLTSCVRMLLSSDGIYGEEFAVKRNETFSVIRKYYPEEKHNPYLNRPQRLILCAAYFGKAWYSIVSFVYKVMKKHCR